LSSENPVLWALPLASLGSVKEWTKPRRRSSTYSLSHMRMHSESAIAAYQHEQNTHGCVQSHARQAVGGGVAMASRHSWRMPSCRDPVPSYRHCHEVVQVERHYGRTARCRLCHLLCHKASQPARSQRLPATCHGPLHRPPDRSRGRRTPCGARRGGTTPAGRAPQNPVESVSFKEGSFKLQVLRAL